MLFEFAKKSNFLQDFYTSLNACVHPVIMHNMEKIAVIKAALGYAAIENLSGCYMEFGIFEGTTLKAAAKIQRTLLNAAKDEFSGFTQQRKFFGFDSFEGGFKHHSPDETHAMHFEGNLSSSYAKCKKRFKKFPEVTLVPGYFEDSIQGKSPEKIIGDEKCAIAFIDCDLKNSTAIALEFIRPALQEGSVIVMDDAYCYKGNPELGVFGAWNDFLRKYPSLKVREYRNYGLNGKSYIVWGI